MDQKKLKYSAKKFQELCTEFQSMEQAIYGWKLNEYSSSSNDDCLQNFRDVATFLNCRMEVVALFYLMKHIQSIAQAVKENRYVWEWQTPSGEGLKQRLGDVRNYILLLAACLDETSSIKNEKGVK
jgi:hypothetical protein